MLRVPARQAKGAISNYFAVQVEYAEHPLDHCVSTIPFMDEPVCIGYDPGALREPRSVFVTAYQDLVIFGSDEAVAAAAGLHDAAAIMNPQLAPYSPLAAGFLRSPLQTDDEYTAAAEAASDAYTVAEHAFLLVVCQEASIRPDRCAGALESLTG